MDVKEQKSKSLKCKTFLKESKLIFMYKFGDSSLIINPTALYYQWFHIL